MTLDEMLAEAAIRRTVAAYAIAGDLQDKDAVAALFTEGGMLRVGGLAVAGRAAIATLLKQGAAARGPAPMVRHNLTTSQITLDGDRARGRTYYLVIDEGGPSHQGCYLDRFAKIGDDWLIAEREVTVDWKA
jgi:ketosteroid isomerase-like protein